MIKIETLKEALNIYDYEADKGLWNYISGIISQAESEGCNTFKLADIGTISSAKLVDYVKGGFTGKPTISEYIEFYNNCIKRNEFLIAKIVKGKVEYELVNSDKMTDDDRRALPKDVWIKHDGKSVPVVEGMKFKMVFECGHEHVSDKVLYWTPEFFKTGQGGYVEKFKILSE